jgi:RimJ/RimL family protein N-acetyltransferase
MGSERSERSRSLWQGERVRLRPVEPDDWATFYGWGQDDLISRMAERVAFPESREAVRRWTERVATKEPVNDRFRWVMVNDDDEAVGSINTHSCDRRVGSFSYGIVLDARWQGQGFGSEAIRLVLRYYFTELGYQKVTVHVYEFNEGSRRLHEGLGFAREGRLRREAYADGRLWDVLVYGMTREEFAAREEEKLPVFAPEEVPAAAAISGDGDSRGA